MNMGTETLFMRWAKAFAVYFCVVVTLHSLIEFLYAHSVFQLQMYIADLSIPSAYVYGLTLGLVLSVAHFVLGKTIQQGRARVIQEHVARTQTGRPAGARKKGARRRKK